MQEHRDVLLSKGKELFSVVGYRQTTGYPTVKLWGLYGTKDEAVERISTLSLSSTRHDERHLTKANGCVFWIHCIRLGPSEGASLF